MISIIICSRTFDVNHDLIINLEKTVGCNFEIICIDNSENKYSIFEAYNLGIKKSNGKYLCFIHDDILFKTNEWGKIVTAIFDQYINIGLIGVAGAKLKTQFPSAWWDVENEEDNVINIIQHHKEKESEIHNYGFNGNKNQKVVVIDGVFMAMRKDERIVFNTELTGFHTYDLNISIEYKKYNYDIVVTNEILIEHFSSGIINKDWVISSYDMHKIYSNILPLGVVNNYFNKSVEIKNAQRFIGKSLTFGLRKIAIYTWFKLFRVNPISKYHYRFWKQLLKTF